MKKRLVTLLCSAVIALSSLTSMTAQAAQSGGGFIVDSSETQSTTPTTDTTTATATTSTYDYASLVARQDFITLSGLTQGVYGQTYNIKVDTKDGYGRLGEADATVTVMQPVITDLGNGWTTAMIPYYASCNLGAGVGCSYTVELVDSISGYTYNTAQERMNFWENYNLTNYGWLTYNDSYIAYTSVAGTRDTAYTVYATPINSNTVENLYWAYLRYPTGTTGLTFCIDALGSKSHPEVTGTGTVGSSLTEQSAKANSLIYFKIN
jgi:hypothetical protein